MVLCSHLPTPHRLRPVCTQLESELNADIDAIKAKRRAELVPEVTQVLGLSMVDATATHTQRRTLPPPPGWKKAQEPPSPSSSSKSRAKGAHPPPWRYTLGCVCELSSDGDSASSSGSLPAALSPIY